MNQKPPAPRRGLGRGLGSLIPTGPPEQVRPQEGEPTSVPSGTSPYASPAAPSVPTQTPEAGSGASAEHHTSPGRDESAHLIAPDDVSSGDDPSDQPPAEVVGAYFAELPVCAIVPNARQPREVFAEGAMAELVSSIKQVGLLQPVVVRRTGATSYELIMGERRWRAVQEAGLEAIPAIVRQTGDDAMLRDALLENLHRSELNPLEEAAAYRQLLDDFGCTHDELASRIGRSRPQISNMLRLLNLSPSVQRRVAAGILSAGHARALLGVSEPSAQDRLAGRVVSEGISVRSLEEMVAVGEVGTAEGDEVGPRARSATPTAPGLTELGERLGDRLDTRVKLTLGRSKGRISIEFASLSDLERIVGVIDPRNREDRPI